MSRVKLKNSIESLVAAGDPSGALAAFMVVGGSPDVLVDILKLAAGANDKATAGESFERLEALGYQGDWIEVAKALSACRLHEQALKAVARADDPNRFRSWSSAPGQKLRLLMTIDLKPIRSWSISTPTSPGPGGLGRAS